MSSSDLAGLGGFLALGVGTIMLLLVVMFVILLVYYIVSSIAYMKVLKIYEYDHPWMAWVPVLGDIALADAACEEKDTMPLLGAELPALLYKLWPLVIFLLALIPVAGSIIATIGRVLLLGNVYAHIYARIEEKPIKKRQLLGFLSGWLTLIATIKFLMYDKTMRLSY